MKGIILTSLSVFWFKLLETYSIRTHLVAYGSGIDQFLPEHLRNDPDLQSRALVVDELDMVDDVEFIIRGYLTGSGKEAYDKTGKLCGYALPSGLQDGDKLPFLMDTPSTKAIEGHDEHMSAEDVRDRYPEQTDIALNIFEMAQNYAESRGIVLADTKFEFGKNCVLGDEALTPDSSRFWDMAEWQESRLPHENRKAPQANDKQIVRQWGKTVGINKRDPKDPDDVTYVHSLTVPEDVIRATTAAYRYIFYRFTGMTIENYLSDIMGVDFPRKDKKIVIICGSESDLPGIRAALNAPTDIAVHVMSCHRNPEELRSFIKQLPEDIDVIIGVGGKALALPGIIDSWAHYFKKSVRVAGVAFGDNGSKALAAAQLSIEEIPGNPVIVDENGESYKGIGGLRKLIERIDEEELPPPKPRTDKPIKMFAV
jgi:phosphoribosylaminoimidazole-succinocarboxamide synthase